MDKDEWVEYRNIEAKAESHEANVQVHLSQGGPREAQVVATLAVSARLEALSYAIRHAPRPQQHPDQR